MSTRFRGLSIDENSKGEMQYGYLIEDGEQAFSRISSIHAFYDMLKELS